MALSPRRQRVRHEGIHHTISTVTPLERVQAELSCYEHLLLDFGARQTSDGEIELLISLKQDVPGAHVYVAPLHPRDIERSQFTWNFQRHLYNCLHDYLVELFLHTPQSQDQKL